MGSSYHNAFFSMNTRCHLVFPNLAHDYGDQVFQEIKNEVFRVEKKLSRFIPESELSFVNTKAAKKPAPIGNELFNILQTCQTYWELTEGVFDITLRPLMRYWNEVTENGRDNERFDQIHKNVGMEHLYLDKINKTVTFDNELIEIDLGGFGKGYALKNVEKLLRKYNVDIAFISFGESSILTAGHHPAGDCWKLGMNNFLNPGTSIHEFHLKNGSMSTSANFYLDNNKKLINNRHVIDPVRGVPIDDYIVVSVCAECPIIAEVLSTAFLASSDLMIKKTMKIVEGVKVAKVDYSSKIPTIKTY